MRPIARMAVFARRALTRGEAALARLLFAEAVPYAAVRLFQAPPAPWVGAVVPFGRTIVFSRWRAAADFADAPTTEQGWLVHELTHVWQAARGVPLAAAKLTALGSRSYKYDLVPGKPLTAYNIEAQAEIARHLFLARRGAPDPAAPPRAALETVWPIPPAARA